MCVPSVSSVVENLLSGIFFLHYLRCSSHVNIFVTKSPVIRRKDTDSGSQRCRYLQKVGHRKCGVAIECRATTCWRVTRRREGTQRCRRATMGTWCSLGERCKCGSSGACCVWEKATVLANASWTSDETSRCGKRRGSCVWENATGIANASCRMRKLKGWSAQVHRWAARACAVTSIGCQFLDRPLAH